MADVTVTAADVLAQSDASYSDGTSGATITAGMAVYVDASDSNKIKIADVTTSAATATVKGIALTGSSSGQPVRYQTGGTVDIGGTVVVGTIYVLSASGAISPAADLITNDYVSVIGVAVTANNIQLKINNSGVQVP